QSASDWGSIPSRHPQLDWGSRDYRLDSRLRGNDTFFVIPHLMRDPFGLDSRLRGNDKKNAGMTARNDILRKS
ncbi:hypothetical protein COS38_00670, partial [Candidatus Berkelbacteria bacterium CG03_land_8_20_14_0_80_40_36]